MNQKKAKANRKTSKEQQETFKRLWSTTLSIACQLELRTRLKLAFGILFKRY
jgi:hypothetical protein